jgi:peptidoglycan/LPS O-acetylase OafA/YrhL
MVTHVKVLGGLYLALSAISLFMALFLALAVGTASAIVGTAADAHDAAIAIPIIGIAGTALVVFLVIVSLPGLIAGIGLLKFRPWARIVGIVVAALYLVHIPFGTIVGIYGLWVLFNKDTEPLFSETRPATV